MTSSAGASATTCSWGNGADVLAGGRGVDIADYETRADPLTLTIDGAPDSGGQLNGRSARAT